MIAYAGHVAIAVSGKHPTTLKELLQNALNKLTNWGDRYPHLLGKSSSYQISGIGPYLPYNSPKLPFISAGDGAAVKHSPVLDAGA